MKKSSFGTVILPGNEAAQAVTAYTFENANLKATILDFGGIIQSLQTKDQEGNFDDIAMGFPTAQEYIEKHMYYGTVVGRVANRIALGQFNLNGQQYQVEKNNNGKAALHGGFVGWGRKIWQAVEVTDNSIELQYVSIDGEEGYPCQITAKVKYTFLENAVNVVYSATNDDQAGRDTLVNMTNHSYFNLSGHENYDGHIGNHKFQSDCPSYLPVNDLVCPTGEIRPVDGTLFDLRQGVDLTKDYLDRVEGGGIDHNYCLGDCFDGKTMNKIMSVAHNGNGRKMEVWTTAPGTQLYTCNFFKGHPGKSGITHPKHGAFAIETQDWPDSINHVGKFPTTSILKAGAEYRHETEFRF